MKPFNLEAAKRGEPICNRNGEPRKFLAHNLDATMEDYRVIVARGDGGEISCHCEDGRFYLQPDSHSQDDLFMSDKPKVKREGWVNVYAAFDPDFPERLAGASSVFDSEVSARKYANNQRVVIATIRIEWEEEAQ